MSDKPAAPQLQVHLDEQIAQGVYVNMATVTHTDAEFTIDLMYVQPQAPRASVRCRAITSPKHMKRLLLALQHNVALYESRHGRIELGPAGDSPVH